MYIYIYLIYIHTWLLMPCAGGGLQFAFNGVERVRPQQQQNKKWSLALCQRGHAGLDTHTHTHTHTHTCTHMHTHAHICTLTRTRSHTRTHARTHIHTHTHTHTHTQTSADHHGAGRICTFVTRGASCLLLP